MTDGRRRALSNRRELLAAGGALLAGGVGGCLGGGGSGDGDETEGSGGGTTTAASPFPPDSCLAAASGAVPSPAYGFEFSGGPSPEVGDVEASTAGDVTVSDGVATFGPEGGSITVEGVRPVNDLTVSLFARPSVEAADQWDVMVWYGPDGGRWSGWGVEHGQGAVDFWAEGPRDADTEVLTESSSPLSVDSWAHVVGVKRGNETRLYVDGERVATSEFPYDAVDYGGAESVTLSSGRHAGGGVDDRYYHGDLDSLAVWDGALSEGEVESLLSASSDCR